MSICSFFCNPWDFTVGILQNPPRSEQRGNEFMSTSKGCWAMIYFLPEMTMCCGESLVKNAARSHVSIFDDLNARQ